MVKISKGTHVKAKKGQILILVLILMAVGMIVMAPLFHYLNSSYDLGLSKITDTQAYYAVDAMIGKIFSDMYAGQDVYINNSAHPEYYSNASWLNGFQINTSIINSMQSPPPPSGSTADAGWIYMDPGCDLGLNSLASGTADQHLFNISLTGGTTVTAHWYFQDNKAGSCSYYDNGKMWITYPNGSYTNGSPAVLSNGVSKAFNQSLSWTVPQNGSAVYTIHFQNLAVRGSGSGCPNGSRNFYDSGWVKKPTFSGIGDPTYTWVSIGNSSGGQVWQYQDYTITTTARRDNKDILKVTACVRQSPGPLVWWQQQNLAVVSWIVCYDPPCPGN